MVMVKKSGSTRLKIKKAIIHSRLILISIWNPLDFGSTFFSLYPFRVALFFFSLQMQLRAPATAQRNTKCSYWLFYTPVPSCCFFFLLSLPLTNVPHHPSYFTCSFLSFFPYRCVHHFFPTSATTSDLSHRSYKLLPHLLSPARLHMNDNKYDWRGRAKVERLGGSSRIQKLSRIKIVSKSYPSHLPSIRTNA